MRRPIVLGYAAAAATALLWAAWIVATRFGVIGSLGPADVAFFRFVVPTVILLPVLVRIRFGFRTPGLRAVALMVFGAGAPFFLVVSTGATFAPAAHLGALAPGTLPLWVALFAVLAGQRFDRARLLGLALILAGALALGGWSALVSGGGEWRGDLMFLVGSMMWAVFTITVRRSGVGAWESAALVNGWSMLLFLPFYLFVFEPRLHLASWEELAVQFVGQGIISGVLALATFSAAIRYLGSGPASAFTALTPAVAALLAIPTLGEWPGMGTWFGVLAVSAGVALASGVFSPRQEPQKGG